MPVDHGWDGDAPATEAEVDAWVAGDPGRAQVVARIVRGLVDSLGAPASQLERVERLARRIAYSRAHATEPLPGRPVRLFGQRE